MQSAATSQPHEPGKVRLTQAAAKEVLRIIDEKKLPAATKLRLGVRGGGCSGYTYVLEFTEKVEPSDVGAESNGVGVVVEVKAYELLQGLEIDFVDDLLNRGFVFQNPNATHTCGCGTSFTV